jgi:DUF4097 and DUF4098 domain-containing protein YvlB
MESKNRNVGIIVAVVLIIMCCCALAAAVGAVAWFTTSPEWSRQIGFGHERMEQTFEVSSAPNLQIDNFAGSVTIRAGTRNEIHVVAIKQASGLGNLDRIKVEMDEQGDGLAIKTRKSSPLNNASVQLEITTPAGTHLDLNSGAGSIEVRGLRSNVEVDSGAGDVVLADVHGEIDVHSGAGSIEARQASGHVKLDTGAGSIDYEGSLQGDCRFESGAGSITLRLPASLDVEVKLETGTGTVSSDYDVVGHVSRQEVQGTIGRGAGGSITAQTGTGSIHLLRR